MVSRMRLYELMPPVKTSLRSLTRRKCFNTITSGASTGNLFLKSVISWAERTPFCMLKLMSTFTSDFFSVSLTIGTWKRHAKNESRKSLWLFYAWQIRLFFKRNKSSWNCVLTDALSRTLMSHSSATLLLMRASFSECRGSSSQSPMTTRSISLKQSRKQF